ncbi:right-handed parallel beta-helix repeat-containing protein [Nocardioides sp.]|uniref:right-handed parallel beta-helix repeat-containing protein n=1 Tax=Nocardioides sp. TaxID=35761 RepID=UPI002D7FB7D1|nr:right-handed parallel beta-helix repeat-containing protein [Nocardioides sp.]HET8961296.1 right-handed parallel beta-helix repeat-containing protein [Nocardioides sp.]
MSRLARHTLALAVVPGLIAVGLAGPASAHEERPADFPDGTGTVPSFAGFDNPRSRVVCRPDSAERIAAMPDGAAKQRSEGMLAQCEFGSIQTAINSIERRDTSVYVLPGVYREQQWADQERSHYCSHLETESDDPLAAAEYIGSLSSPDRGTAAAAEDDGASDPIALSYADQRRCAHNLNLIAAFGDKTPHNDDISCDSKFCGTQIVGTGHRMTDVTIDNRFSKLNALRLDRMGGAVVRNLTVQQAEFNAVYVLETDGFLLDRVTARGNDEYGILAFASDHGLIQHSNAYYNGDSGIYPGSGSDLNADNEELEVTRYAIEIRHNRSHDNTLGYSGTAGNSIWAHHNDFFDNATGIATDSLFPGHPGLPQDHARWSHNRIYSNNSNYYTEYVDTGVCDKPMEERGYMDGTVCPVVPTPVGTGVLIAGGNFNSTDHNWIYDNWRYGTMQFWVPSVLRDEYDPSKQFDTSHHNHTTDNHMGIAPNGEVAHNGLDHWWDDEGEGNCWEDNTYSRGERTDNFTVPPPSCADGGSAFTPGAPVKDAGFLSCSQYDRSDPTFRHPPMCEWFDDPAKPDESGAAGASVDQSSDLLAAPLVALTGLLFFAGLGRRRRVRGAA